MAPPSMLAAACEQRTKYGLDHPPSCYCKIQIKPDAPKVCKPAAKAPPKPPPRQPQHQPPPRCLSAAPTAASLPLPSPRKPLPSPRSRNVPPPAGAPGVACAAQCHLHGEHVNQGLLQQPSKFFVVVRDALGEPVRRGGDTVRCSSRGPGPLRPSVVDSGDGSYTVSYLATVSGTYQLSLTCNSIPIAGSPLMITVEPSSAHAPLCVADGTGLQRAIAGESTSFFVRAHDVLGRPKVMGGETFDAFAQVVEEEANDEDEIDALINGSPSAKVLASSYSSGLTSLGAVLNPSLGGSPRTPKRNAAVVKYKENQQATAAAGAGLQAGSKLTPSQQQKLHAVSIADLSNGSYEGRYTIRSAGRYMLHVHRQGVHISGSPFALRVLPAAAHTSTCELRGEGIAVSEAGKRTTFTLISRDQFGNARKVAPRADASTGPLDGLILSTDVLLDASPERFEAMLMPLRVEHIDVPPVRCSVKPMNNGSGYYVTYLASAAGEYEVGVSLGGEPIKQKPNLTIVPSGCRASATTASGGGVVSALAGSVTSFMIESRDEFGNGRDGRADDFVVMVRPARRLKTNAKGGPCTGLENATDEAMWIYEYDADGEGRNGERSSTSPILGSVHARGDGKYVAEYLVHDAGAYLLDVHASGELIAGAPFRLTVLPSPIHALSCRVIRAGPQTVRAGQTALLKFESCDMHGNRRTNGGDRFHITLSIDPQNADPSATAYTALLSASGLGDVATGSEAIDVSDGGVNGMLVPESPSRRHPPSPTVLDEYNGVYTVGYGWSKSGGLLLSINDDHHTPIADSPFALEVLADAPSASHSVAHGPWLRGEGTAGEEMRVVVILRDQFGNVCEQSPDGVGVVLKGAYEVPGSVRRFSRNGVSGIEAIATPQVAGRYWLHLTLRGAPIGRSPYGFTLKPAKADARSSEMWGGGITAASAGVPAYFAIQLRDALGNAASDGADDVKAYVEPPSRIVRQALGNAPPSPGEEEAALIREEDDGNETCECTIQQTGGEAGLFSGVWRTLRAGRHRMHVTLRGEPLPGSPFIIISSPGPTHAPSSNFYIEGGASREFRPNELVVVRIFARDRWTNVRGEGGDDFHIFVQGAARPSMQELEDLRSGEYELRLRLPLSGSYFVHVQIAKGAVPLQSSPLKVTVGV